VCDDQHRLRTPEIEETQQAARVAIFEWANALKEEEFAGPTLWKAALRATESWIELFRIGESMRPKARPTLAGLRASNLDAE
jgi:hypothetical protein